jgi:hypothetical protein
MKQRIQQPMNKSPKKKEKYKNINHNKMKQMEFLQKVINDLPDIYSNIPSFTQTFSKTNKNVGIIFWYLPITPNPNPHPNNPKNTHKQKQKSLEFKRCLRLRLRLSQDEEQD